MMKKEIKVYALPTEKAIYGPAYGNYITVLSKETGKYIKDWTYERYMDGMRVPNPHHLYATTEEQPKNGDYTIAIDTNILFQVGESDLKGINSFPHLYRKVVATTDKELEIKYNGAYFSNYQKVGYKQLPQISPEFQQAYVREANQENVITEAQMEFDYNYDGKADYTIYDFPKINEQGYVTIFPKVEKMYSKKEAENLVKLAYKAGSISSFPDQCIMDKKISLSDFIKQHF